MAQLPEQMSKTLDTQIEMYLNFLKEKKQLTDLDKCLEDIDNLISLNDLYILGERLSTLLRGVNALISLLELKGE